MNTLLKAYWKYFWEAKDEHSIHSPFVFEFYTRVIKNKKYEYYAYEEIEKLRKLLLNNQEVIYIEDFGAGSKVCPTSKRSIQQIAKTATKPAKIGQMLFRMTNYFQPKYVFDLGTCLGITTAYLAAPLPNSDFYTFEGAKSLGQIAQKHFKMLHLPQIKLIEGNIDLTLPKALGQIPQLDFVFVDANHRFEPTYRYFEWMLAKSHEDTVMIFDDIYWSEEMQKAWEKIYQHPQVTISIDLFDVGIVFFRKKQPKQHFILKF
ncbi:MAG: class I SAM-dependent methyltransferase [Raineya sp.]